jgi:hypothetical protein
MPVYIESSAANSVEGAVTQIFQINCAASAAVDDYVRISTTVNNMVDVATDNLLPRPIIGRIVEKLSATVCSVAASGILPDPDSTGPGVIYLSVTGRATITPPAENYRNKLGYSFGNGFIDFKPEKTLIKIT